MIPLFSIITVCYNAEAVIETTLKSISQQTYKNYEHIIVDGSSKDKTLTIIEKYKTDKTALVSEKDKGIYDAMNKGIRKAQGTYLWFMNAGDRFYNKQVLQKLVPLIERKDPDILYGETINRNTQNEIVGMRRLKAPKKLNWKSFKQGMLVCHQSFVVKKTLAPFYDLNYQFSADVDWCIRCMKKTVKIENTHHILACYLDEGTTTNNHKASLKERYHIMCKHYGILPTTLRHIWFALRYYWAKKVVGRV